MFVYISSRFINNTSPIAQTRVKNAEIGNPSPKTRFHMRLAWSDFMLAYPFIARQISMVASIRQGVVRKPHGSVTS